MSIDPSVLSSLITAVGVLGNEYLKGIATEAGTATWTRIKALFGWTSDPSPAEINQKAATALTVSPDIAVKLLELLKQDHAALVQTLTVNGGKVVVARDINNLTM